MTYIDVTYTFNKSCAFNIEEMISLWYFFYDGKTDTQTDTFLDIQALRQFIIYANMVSISSIGLKYGRSFINFHSGYTFWATSLF